MSFAFCDPPDSGVNTSASAGPAAIRIATAASEKAARSRRLGRLSMPAGKAAGSYIRPRRRLHFVRVVPKEASGCDLELADPQPADLELLDPEVGDHRPPDCKPADRDRPECGGAERQRTDRACRAHVGSAGLGARGERPARHRYAPSKEGSRFSTKAVTP